MHWILQENLNPERYRHDDLVAAITKAGGTHSVHKVVPFSGDIIPDYTAEGPTVVMGPYSLASLAKRKGWSPGAWDLDHFTFPKQKVIWGKELLNYDATVCEFAAVNPKVPEIFIRPTSDSKCFAGHVINRDDFLDWRRRVVQLGENDGSGLSGSTEVFWCQPKEVNEEYRLWVVDNKIVTASRYRKDGRLSISDDVPKSVIIYGSRMINRWRGSYAHTISCPPPSPAYVMDVCWCWSYGWKIVELNTLNACGFYAADLDKLVAALEGLYDRGRD